MYTRVINKTAQCNSNVAVNVSENDNEYLIALQAAGYTKEELKIKLDSNLLTVKAETKEQEGPKYIRKEFGVNGFERSFKLPEGVLTENISAEHNNGILYVHIPKKEKVEIQIKDIEVSN